MSVSKQIRAKASIKEYGLENPFVAGLLRRHGTNRIKLYHNDMTLRTFNNPQEFIQYGIGIVGARLESRREMANLVMNGRTVVVMVRKRTYLK